jgi:plastocyanin
MAKEGRLRNVAIGRSSGGLTRIAATFLILVILILMIGTVAIFDIIYTTSHQTPPASGTSSLSVSQTPRPVYMTLTWEKAPQALQDRFTPANIVVAQGDTVHVTFIVNDSSAHTFTLGSPYNFQINVTVPGLTDDLTGNTFTTSATNNSPGVAIRGTIGNLTGTGSFVAKYAGIYEFFCFYHVQIGMFGYLTVMPNSQYNASQTTSSTSQTSGSQVAIEYGSGAKTSSVYFSPPTIVVVIGVNNTVTWTNDDIVAHTVTSDTGVFDSGNIAAGATWSYTFATAGTYNYHCSYHSWMTGTVVVKSG